MSCSLLRLRGVLPCVFIVLVGVPCFAPMATADDEPFGDKPAAAKTDENPDRASEAKIRRALGSPTTLEFFDEPLGNVIDYVSDQHGIEIEFHPVVEEEGAAGPETPVTVEFKAVSLRTALRLLLEKWGLTFVVRDGVLLITTPEAASAMIDVRVYDVTHLIYGEHTASDVAMLLQSIVEPDASAVDSQAARPAGGTRQLAAAAAESPGRVSPVIAGQTRFVPFDNLLVVSASLPDHDRIVDVLNKMVENLNPPAK